VGRCWLPWRLRPLGHSSSARPKGRAASPAQPTQPSPAQRRPPPPHPRRSLPAGDPVGHTLYDGPSVLSNVLFAGFAQQAGPVARQVAYPLAWSSTGVLASQKHRASGLYFDQRPAASGKPATVIAPGVSGSLSGLVDADGGLSGGCGSA
jgi:hypothetical protein